MKSINTKLLVSVALAGAMWSGAALAQSSFGGSGESPRAVPGGPELSDRGVAVTPPKVELDEIGRDLALDPEKLKESFGTVSRSRGGEEKREAPSEDVLRSLDGAFNPNPNADPAFAESGDRQVFGADDRVQVTDSSNYPFRVFGLLQAETKDGFSNCSATLIGPRTLLTAAHCLYDHDDGWYDNFVFAPGLVSMDNAPFGVWEYETAYIFEGYISNYQGYYGSVVPWDIAVVVLQQPVGDHLGWLGYGHDPKLGDFHANIIGYPGDKPAGTMWRANCDVSAQAVQDQYFQYHCDTYAGTSGGAVYKYDPQTQERTILGVNVAESANANTAVRMNQTYFNWVKGLVQ